MTLAELMTLRDMAEAGWTLKEIGDYFGKSRECARLWLNRDGLNDLRKQRRAAKLAEAATVANHQAERVLLTTPPIASHMARSYTDDDMLAAVRACADAVDGPVSRNTYTAWRRDRTIPSSAAIIHRFGSWREATALAGVASGTTYRTSWSRQWSDAEMEAMVHSTIVALLNQRQYPSVIAVAEVVEAMGGPGQRWLTLRVNVRDRIVAMQQRYVAWGLL